MIGEQLATGSGKIFHMSFIISHLPFTARSRFEIDEGQLKDDEWKIMTAYSCALIKWQMRNDK